MYRMRWSLTAATLAILTVCLAVEGQATDDGARAELKATALPTASPVVAELPRQDPTPRSDANTSTLTIRATQTPPVKPRAPAVASPNSRPVVTAAPADREPQLIFKEPIGIRIDYNPYAVSDSPSLCFQQGLDRAALAARPSEPRLFPVPTRMPVDSAYSINSAFRPPTPSMDEQGLAESAYQRDGDIFIEDGVFRAAFQQPLAPLQPLQPVQPPSIAPYQPNVPSALDTLGTTSIAELAAAVGGSPAQVPSKRKPLPPPISAVCCNRPTRCRA
jgi:hypothetical protein